MGRQRSFSANRQIPPVREIERQVRRILRRPGREFAYFECFPGVVQILSPQLESKDR